jgi:hypothetical protein
MNTADRRALARCLKLVETHPTDLGRRRQMWEKKLDRESWIDRATFACQIAQQEAMHLKPWECTPAFSDPAPDDTDTWSHQKAKARIVANRLRQLGLSIYEPSPLDAIAKAEELLGRQAAPALRITAGGSVKAIEPAAR